MYLGSCRDYVETLKARARARNRRAALKQIYPNGSFDVFAYEVEALIECGELVPRSLVAARKLDEPLPDLSE